MNKFLLLFILFVTCLSCAQKNVRKVASLQEEYIVDSHAFAQAIVKHADSGDEVIDENLLNYKYLMAIKKDSLEKIDKEGIINGFSTGGESNGSFTPWKRTENELKMMGLPGDLGVGPKEIRPKYSYVNMDGKYDTIMFRNYGDIILEFRSRVGKRSSFTFGDSLNGAIAFPAYEISKELIEEGNLIGEWGVFDYTEGQIWGKLSYYDVEYVFVKSDIKKEQMDMVKKLSKKFGFGIKTYSPYSENSAQFQMSKIKLVKEAKKNVPETDSKIIIKGHEDLKFFHNIVHSDFSVKDDFKIEAMKVLKDNKLLGESYLDVKNRLLKRNPKSKWLKSVVFDATDCKALINLF